MVVIVSYGSVTVFIKPPTSDVFFCKSRESSRVGVTLCVSPGCSCGRFRECDNCYLSSCNHLRATNRRLSCRLHVNCCAGLTLGARCDHCDDFVIRNG